DFINHELSVNLDSTNAFEGPEKLLEIWFSESFNLNSVFNNCNSLGLRNIPLNEIEKMLDLVNCKILSKISNNLVDSYLLSESSLFIYSNKLILKTCGTTTTLFCLEKLLELVLKYCNYKFKNFNNIYKIFYSRRSLMFPNKQNKIHQSWDNELMWLNKYFKKDSSKSYIVGDLLKDHWYLYLNGSETVEIDDKMYPLSPVISNSSTSSTSTPTTGNSFKLDQTFELLMTELNPESSLNFQLSKHENEFPNMNKDLEDYGHLLGMKMMEKTGLNNIIPENNDNDNELIIKHDAFAFNPCGFSSNTLIDNEYYYTFHITPELGWSYASFETNYPNYSKFKIVNKIINVLKPGEFFLIFVDEMTHGDDDDVDVNDSDCEFNELKSFKIDNYNRFDKISYDLKFNYRLLYSHFKLI
ncbi:hypothetical protein CANARDRAFT_179717, partial [[Candida] arabinofermentans NRRL YB-2248]